MNEFNDRLTAVIDELEALIDLTNDAENKATYPADMTLGNALRQALNPLRMAEREKGAK